MKYNLWSFLFQLRKLTWNVYSPLTYVRVSGCQKPAKTCIQLLIIFSIAKLSIKPLLVLNQHWNQKFYYENFVSPSDFHGILMAIPAMAPNWFQCRVITHFIALRSKGKYYQFWPILATLTWEMVNSSIVGSVIVYF